MALGGLAAMLLVLLCVLLAAGVLERRRLREALDASRADVDVLRARLEELERSAAVSSAASVVPHSEYVITTAGVPTGSTTGVSATEVSTGSTTGVSTTEVPNRVVLSATLGEPLVKLMAFGYGVRRALSAESRNRIMFEMRREVRRARKDRRREARDAVRAARREAAA